MPPSRHVQVLVLASVFFCGFGQAELLPLLLVAVLGAWAFLVLAFDNRTVWMPVASSISAGLGECGADQTAHRRDRAARGVLF
jgi:hypothetical protein